MSQDESVHVGGYAAAPPLTGGGGATGVRNPGNGQGCVVDGMIEKYCKRPKGVQRAYKMPENVDAEVDFDAIKCEFFWLEWNIVSSVGNKAPSSTRPYYLNEHNTACWRRSNGVRILGFGFTTRTGNLQFYYHHLIHRRPFLNLDEYLRGDRRGNL